MQEYPKSALEHVTNNLVYSTEFRVMDNAMLKTPLATRLHLLHISAPLTYTGKVFSPYSERVASESSVLAPALPHPLNPFTVSYTHLTLPTKRIV